MIKHLSLKAYGKINLGLDVLRRRDDGYHEVRMIMQTVGIYDRIDLIYKETPGITVETNLYYLPDNENPIKKIYSCCSRYGRRKQRCGSSAVWRQ